MPGASPGWAAGCSTSCTGTITSRTTTTSRCCRRFDPRIAAGFDLLEADHQALGAAMQELAQAANAVLRAVDEGAAADLAAEGSTRPSPASAGSSTGTWSTRRNWWCR